AAQYLARGLPCERFTAALASRASCITRGRGGWLDLPRGGLPPPILCQLPGARRGRDEDYSSPPAQIPACAANAPGSSLRSNVGCTRFETGSAPAAQPPIGTTWPSRS